MTPDLLRAATGCTAARAALFAQPLSDSCTAYGITTPARLAAFLAQIGHESASLHYVLELADGHAYEGRKSLGNTEPGDGPRFRGRGLIQVTGRANYRETAARLLPRGGPDFEHFPEALEEPRWAAWSAADWWHAHGCNQLADAGQVVAIGRLINRGSAASQTPANGEADRLQRFERARAALASFSPAPAPPPPPAPPPEAPPAPTQFDDTMPAGEAPDWVPPTPPEKAMAPFLLPAAIELAKMIPQLGGMFANSETAQRNVKAAEVVVNAVTSAVGASNAQEAVEKVAVDPAARAAAAQAVQSVWFEITEAGGGGIDGARKAAAAYSMPDGPRFWLNPAFWISAFLLLMPTMLLIDVFWVHPEAYQGELRTQIVTGVLLIISIVGGYWLGTSFSSARKTELGARQ